jgi:transcriptional regulator with XRE-family HTH domain
MRLTNELREAAIRRSLPPAEQRRALREATGISQAALAAELGVSRATLSRWELGTRVPRGELLKRYSDLLRRLLRAQQRSANGGRA